MGTSEAQVSQDMKELELVGLGTMVDKMSASPSSSMLHRGHPPFSIPPAHT